MENTKSKVVMFYDDEIPCLITADNRVYVPIRTIAKAIGLNAQSATDGVKNDEILSQVYADHRIVAADGKVRIMQLLPIEYVHGWLFSIDLSKVNEQAKPKLQLYKRECYQVLYNYFFGKYRRVEENVNRRFHLVNKLHDLEAQKQHCENEMKRIRRQLEELQQQDFNQLGLFEAVSMPMNLTDFTE